MSEIAWLRQPRGEAVNYSASACQMLEGLFILEKTTMYRLFLALILAMAQAVSAQPNLKKTTVAYKKIDGHEILADVYRPKDDRICAGNRSSSWRSPDYGKSGA